MKKYIIIFVLVAMIAFVPLSKAKAALTDTQVNAIIALLESFGADATTVANVKVALTGGSPVVQADNKTLYDYIGMGLIVGNRGASVVGLQRALIAKGLLPTGQDDGKFGKKTLAAVNRYRGVGSGNNVWIDDGKPQSYTVERDYYGRAAAANAGSCTWKNAADLTTTDGALGQTCLNWVQSFAGAGITADKIRVENISSSLEIESCAYEDITYGNPTTRARNALYSGPNEKPIRTESPLSIRYGGHKTQVCTN